MKKQINALFAKILNRQFTELRQEIDKLNTNVATQEERIVSQEAHIASQEEHIVSQEERIVSQEERIISQEEEIKELNTMQFADENDFKAFYNLLLKRDPEVGAFRENVYRKELFNNIIFSEEYDNVKLNKNDGIDETVSYAQAGEDSILLFVFGTLKMDLSKITYLDLGANRVKNLSNTFMFYEKGASGVLVDANPKLCSLLEAERINDITLNKCISNTNGEKVDFYIMNNDGLSSPDKNCVTEAMKVNSSLNIEEIVKVETITVTEIFEKYFNKNAPTILNIDIEGNEIEILSSIDFDKYRPLIVICEMIPYNPSLVVGNKNKDIENLMKDNGYLEYAFTGINSIFIDKNIEGLFI